AMELVDEANKGKLTTEKVVTKGVMSVIPMGGGKVAKQIGESRIEDVINVTTMGADKVIDGMRDTKSGHIEKIKIMNSYYVGLLILSVILIIILIKGKNDFKNWNNISSKNKMFYLRSLIIISVGIILLMREILK